MNNILSQANTPSVMIIDDDEEIGNLIYRCVEKMGCRSITITDSRLAKVAFSRFRPDLVFLDLRMPGKDGLQIMRELSEINCDAQLIPMSGLNERVLNSALEVARSLKLSVLTTLHKPFKGETVRGLVSSEIDRLNRELDLKNDEDHNRVIPGPSLQFEPVFSTGNDSEKDPLCNRLYFTWRADNGHDITFDRLFDDSHKAEAIAGLAGLMLSTLGKEISAMDPAIRSELQFYYTIRPEFLIQAEAVYLLNELLLANNLEPAMFTLEIDEKTLLANPAHIQETMSRLEIQGFRIALVCAEDSDTVLARARSLPVDELQIDLAANQLLSSRTQSSEADFWLGSLVSFARKEGLNVSARNVNTQAQYLLAKKCGVRSVSGSYLGASRSYIAPEDNHELELAL
jgi:EAL domain-containing protein (putative c-di-GMP-specific phosphodiesterase class I)